MKLSRLTFALLIVTAGIPASGAADSGEAPLVDAGLDQSVVTGTTVYLDGGGTVDPDGEIVEYRWSIETPRGETTTPTDPNAVMTRFVAEQAGRYRVTLTATDDDGNTRSDTLFVDVGGSVDTRTGSPASEQTEPASTPVETGSPPPAYDGSTDQLFQNSGNQDPLGRILGPDSVRAGSSVRYVLRASDADGRIVDSRWLSPSHSESSVATTDADSIAQTYTFDVEPGTEVTLPAVVIDDDDALSRVKKTVQVTNNPPKAMIHGNSTVTVGSVHEYEVMASDPDGPVTSFAWATGSSAVEAIETGGLLSGNAATDRTRNQLFRFTEIPEDDATVTLRATVKDEHGGATTAEKEVAVVVQGSKSSELKQPASTSRPKIINSEASQNGLDTHLFGRDEATPGRITFTAVATDNDSEQLTFEWQFGDFGSVRTVESGETMRSEVSFSFAPDEIDFHSPVPVTVTVTDQNGNSKTVTEELDFRQSQPVRFVEDSIDVDKTGRMSIRGTVNLGPMSDGDEPPSYVKIYLGDGTVKTLDGEKQSDNNGLRYHFNHRYQSAGMYLVQVQNEETLSRQKISVGSRTYMEWVYEQRITSTTRTVAEKRPAGEGWKRAGVNHVRYEKTGAETSRTRISNGETLDPGGEWERVGTDVEYHTEQRTTRATESPGSEWRIAERNVDQQSVFTGWETKTVPSRRLANPDWEYIGKVATTTTRTQTKQSATRPSGSGWKRGSPTGDSVRTGYSTEWVTNRFFVGNDWEYVESQRYVSGYSYSTRCVEYANFRLGSYCIEEQTVRSANYDTRYKYRVPEYSPEYEWERTVEETTYDHQYRTKTYTTKPVHEYKKTEEVETKYAVWEKAEYNETDVYEWKKTETRWERTTSLSEPVGDVRNVEKHVRECGDSWEPGEPETCRRGEP